MSSSESWFKAKNKGDMGEYLVKNYMSKKHNFIDVSNDREFQKIDVDFIIAGYYCELKTDYVINYTDNLFLEYKVVYNRDNSEGEGWFNYTQAQYLFYLDIKKRNLYIYQMPLLREYIETHDNKTIQTQDTNKIVYGYCLWKNAVPHQTIHL